MTPKISRCNSCGNFFESKKELKVHIDKIHRITDSKILPERITNCAILNNSLKKFSGEVTEKDTSNK
ncbi:MAG: hypothetical protein M3270_01345 [Thermoproteota archaeon]|nr:hypothetical protein [Thermoproteota archaeon]